MASKANAVLCFDSVSQRFGETLALAEITFEIARGEIFGVIGESGAGKSTLLELVLGLQTPTSGTITVAGRDVSRLQPAALRSMRRDMGVVFQSIDLLSSRTVRQNVEVPLRFAGTRLSARTRRAAVNEMLEFVGLPHRASHYPAQLSGGEQQRVGLARALITHPAVLLCDEPTSALDAATTVGVVEVLQRAQRELGTTIVVISHNLSVISALCDRAVLLERGRMRDLFTVRRTPLRSMPSYYDQVRSELM